MEPEAIDDTAIDTYSVILAPGHDCYHIMDTCDVCSSYYCHDASKHPRSFHPD